MADGVMTSRVFVSVTPWPMIVLSPTERRVFALFLAGHSVPMIADSCGISFYTVREHLNAVVRKFGVDSPAELLYVANRRAA
jgi:DNA-binding NarL/FixJ family response regulator